MAAVSVEDVASRREQQASPLFAGRVKVYPKAVSGRMRRVKWATLVVLLAVYYLTPWLRWDRGPGAPDQAILLDIAGRRAFFLGLEIWPQELYFLAGLMIMAAFGLFLATTLAGRVWCGYACPQTVWTDLFMAVERWIQGDRNARIRLDRQPWARGKALRKAATHAVWLLIAFLTGGVWVTYFTDAPTVTARFLTGQASLATYVFVGLFTTTTYVLGGLAREQVCTYMCPWPRFQAALTDEHSLIVTYQRWRGEPRGAHKSGETWDGRGDCVDCRQCVAVCPTGIDIRDGWQLECIGCGLCVDACDAVMGKVGRPRGLVTIDSEASQRARAAGRPPRFPLARPRTLVYAALLLATGALMLGGLAARGTAEMTVLADRAPLFVELSDGSIQNGYTLKIENRTRTARRFVLTADAPVGARLAVVGGTVQGGGWPLEVGPDAIASFRVLLRMPRAQAAGADVALVLTEADGTRLRAPATFAGPGR
jgi:cytochrome c oxidase accessory protein FixG